MSAPVVSVAEDKPAATVAKLLEEDRLLTELRAKPWAMLGRLTVVIRDGVVHLCGLIGTDGGAIRRPGELPEPRQLGERWGKENDHVSL
ncbi:MAG: hypothetical protein Q8R92_17970 [Deltaproteobacteria bacterium]|nr:hypothetical protein [Deltaproteobacteria bacterium]